MNAHKMETVTKNSIASHAELLFNPESHTNSRNKFSSLVFDQAYFSKYTNC